MPVKAPCSVVDPDIDIGSTQHGEVVVMENTVILAIAPLTTTATDCDCDIDRDGDSDSDSDGDGESGMWQ